MYEISNNESEHYKQTIFRIVKHPIPIEKYETIMQTPSYDMADTNVDLTNLDEASCSVNSPQKFRQLLQTVKDMYSVIDQDWVDQSVEHETEHLNEARRLYDRFGDRVSYEYSLTCVSEGPGLINFIPRYVIKFYGVRPEVNETEQVDNAPRSKSITDLMRQGKDIRGKDRSKYHKG